MSDLLLAMVRSRPLPPPTSYSLLPTPCPHCLPPTSYSLLPTISPHSPTLDSLTPCPHCLPPSFPFPTPHPPASRHQVKTGHVSAFSEKRASCSINTWLRGPGICAFCTICILGWSAPYPGTPPSHVMPWYLFWPSMAVVFFNGQYYAQRVIGNYYIRKAQDHARRGIQRVDLHAS